MVAGLLARAGYFMGRKLDAYRGDTNPKGFFEDPDINALNERILEPVVARRPREPIGRLLFPRRSVNWSHWLTCISPDTIIPPPRDELVEWIRFYTRSRPFCFKDPRFSYTLSAWRREAPTARCICVFREPNRTAQSMVKEARHAEYLRHFKFEYSDALRVWQAMYSRILNEHACAGEWLFVHYDQALDGTVFESLERFTGAQVDRTFPEGSLARTEPVGRFGDDVRATYERLCELAHYAGAVPLRNGDA